MSNLEQKNVKNEIKIPKFVEGVCSLMNIIHNKYDILTVGYASDVCTANGYNYTFEYDPESEEYKPVLIKDIDEFGE